MGFDYTELFWKKKRTFKFDYTSTLDTNWDFLGFCFPINMIQIDNSYYYISEDIPTGIPGVEGSRVRGTGFDDLTTKVDIKYYKLSDVNIITESDMCLFSSTERLKIFYLNIINIILDHNFVQMSLLCLYQGKLLNLQMLNPLPN